MKHFQVFGVIAAMAVTQAAGAAGNTPINTPDRAARSVYYLFELPNTITQQVNQLDYETRVVIEHGFDQLDAATTVPALLAAPGGLVIACPLGGTLTARMSRGAIRTVRFEWKDCQQPHMYGPYTTNGPAEVTTLEASFSPKTLYSIRLGDATHDHLEYWPRLPGRPWGEYTVRRNQRFTGVIPQRTFDWENPPERFTYEATGFDERTQMLPERFSDPPTAPLYPYVNVSFADHALIARERSTNTDANQVFHYAEDVVLAWGSLGYRYDAPRRPTRPATSETSEYRGFGLRLQNFTDGPLISMAIDGKVEVTNPEAFQLGCTAPETFTYRTRVRPVTPPDRFTLYAFAQGEVQVNGSTIRFTEVPLPEPSTFDTRSRIDISSPRLGPASYFVNAFDYTEVWSAAHCAPWP